MADRPHALIRCDAAPAIGAGHVMRCLTLADALAAEGWRCGFVCAEGTAAAVAALRARPYAVTERPGPGPDDLRAAAPDGVDLLVVDHYGWDAAREAPLRGWARRILVIDDLADRAHACDLLLDQSPARRATDYAGLVPAQAVLLTGGAYALIRPEIAAARPWNAALSTTEPRVIVAPGATDPDNVTEVFLAGLAGTGLEADVILSSAAPHLERVRAACAAAPFPARLHVDVRDMAALQAGARLAVGAPGGSALERCVLGLPSLLVVTADNQLTNARALTDAGAARLLGRADALTAEAVAAAVQALDEAALSAMRQAALALCDGRGRGRVLNVLLGPERDRLGRAVTLRPAVFDDWARLLDWQRAPETRRYFHDPRVPDEADHKAWLAKQLARPRAMTNLVLADGAPVGVIRLDPATEDPATLVVSILVAPEAHGAGIGRLALAQAARLAPEARLVAEVHSDNAASHRLFRACGFEADGAGGYSLAPRLGAAPEQNG